MSSDDDRLATADGRRIAVVGACASGKTLLVDGLRSRGYDARQVLQEHSYVPAMWQRITRPDVLIYLDVSLGGIRGRRKIDFDDRYLREQRRRLAHAIKHADISIHTDELSPGEILDQVISFLEEIAEADVPAGAESSEVTGGQNRGV